MFCLRRVAKKQTNPATPLYIAVPYRKEVLRKMVPDMCQEAVISRRTNHSLCAMGATEMFQSEVPEKIIQSRTGHLSLKAL